MSVEQVDVIIAGTGPAGSTAARQLAGAGVRVLMLERDRLPRQKPCGGGISTRALKRFPWLPHALQRIPSHPVSSLHLEGPSGRAFRMQSNGPAVVLVRRLEYDYLLATLAREAGARIIDQAAIGQASQDRDGVTLTTRDRRVFRAAMVIAADGVNSVIARRLGINPGWPRAQLALDMMEETPIETLRPADPDTMSVFYGYGGAHGYAYIFPKKAHLNVGIGYLLPYFDAQVGVAPYDIQRSFVGDLVQRGLAQGESRRAHFTPFLIPIGGPLKTTARGRVLLAGDAGGFVNGFSAEGIYYAMVTGDLAARAARGAGGQRDRSGAGAATLRAGLAQGDRRGAARLGAGSEIPVPRARAHGPRRRRRQRAAGVLRDPGGLRQRPPVLRRRPPAAAVAFPPPAAAPGGGGLPGGARQGDV